MNLSIQKFRNIRLVLYKLFQKTRCFMPRFLAKMLAAGNRSDLPSAVLIPTYDGSGQAVHPSIARFRQELYLCCTPYPYGCEGYENPCVYRFRGGWKPAGGKPAGGAYPLVKPRRIGFEHYSDPCLYCDGEQLCMIFRKCERRSTNPVDQLYYSTSSDGVQWTEPELIAEEAKNMLISPAVDYVNGTLYCVEALNEEGGGHTRLVRYRLEYREKTPTLRDRTISEVRDLPTGYYVWHIDVGHGPNGICGLFSLMGGSEEGKLAVFHLDGQRDIWIFEREVSLEEPEREAVQMIYKSALIDGTNRILFSFMDRKARWFLFERQI